MSGRSPDPATTFARGMDALGPLLVGLLAALIVSATGPAHAAEDFYPAASGVIPVLLLAFAIQVRLLPARLPPPIRRRSERETRFWLKHPQADRIIGNAAVPALVLFSMGLLGVAELDVLNVIARSEWREHDPETTLGSIGFGIGILVALPVREAIRASFANDDR